MHGNDNYISGFIEPVNIPTCILENNVMHLWLKAYCDIIANAVIASGHEFMLLSWVEREIESVLCTTLEYDTE